MDLKHPTNETLLHSQPIKPLLSFTHVKNHHAPPPTAASTYKECLKNHAAGIGGHAVDGCGEFMSSPTSTPTEPTSFTCAACGCHRNFHRRDDFSADTVAGGRTSTSPSPPPPPQYPTNYYAPHVLLSLTTASTAAGEVQNQAVATPGTPVAIKIENPSGRKRFRTKFSHEQKEKMYVFAEKVGWKMQRCDEKMVADFCHNIGIKRGIFKVWMHNNKNTFGKREKEAVSPVAGAAVGGGSSESREEGVNGDGRENDGSVYRENGGGGGGSSGGDGGCVHVKGFSNGSSSSS